MEKQRKCLRCGNDFLSSGPGNRICQKCNDYNGRRMGREPQKERRERRGRDPKF